MLRRAALVLLILATPFAAAQWDGSAPLVEATADPALPRPTTPVSWFPVPGATLYEVTVEDERFLTPQTRWDPPAGFAGGDHVVRVRALRDQARGEASAPIAFMLPARPSAAPDASAGRGAIAWTPVEHAARYEVVVARDAQIADVLMTYRVEGTAAAPRAPDGSYHVAVRAVNSAGAGPWSASVPLDLSTPLEVPAPFASAAGGATTPPLRWKPTEGGASYDVEITPAGGQPVVETVRSTAWLAERWAPGEYSARVRARTPDAASGWSGPIGLTIVQPLAERPTLKDDLTWGAVGGATQYAIEISANGRFDDARVLIVDAPTLPAGALAEGESLRVRAVKGGSAGPWSQTRVLAAAQAAPGAGPSALPLAGLIVGIAVVAVAAGYGASRLRGRARPTAAATSAAGSAGGDEALRTMARALAEEHERRRRELEVEVEGLRRANAEAQARLGQAETSATQLRQLHAELAAANERSRALEASAQEQGAVALRETEAGRMALAQRDAELERLRREHAAAVADGATAQRSSAQLAAQLSEARERGDAAEARLREIEARLEAALAAAAMAESRAQALDDRVGKLSSALQSVRGRLPPEQRSNFKPL